MNRRAPPERIVLSFEERRRLASFVLLLVQVDRRASAKNKIQPSPKGFGGQEGQKDEKHTYKIKGSQNCGPIFLCVEGALFLFRTDLSLGHLIRLQISQPIMFKIVKRL